MPSYSLDDIEAEANTKFEAVEFNLGDDTVVLLPSLRLTGAQRAGVSKANDALKAVQDNEDASTEDFENALLDVMCSVAKDPKVARKAFGRLPLAGKITVIELYKSGTQLGEA